MEKADFVSFHKKNDQQVVSDYWSVSLLHICSKIFENLFFNKLLKVFQDDIMLSQASSDFRPSDLSIYQMLAITHNIFLSFDCN